MAAADTQIEALVESMSRAEKLSLVRGATDPTGRATGFLPGIDRLGIPELRMVDGPLGVRVEDEAATAFPAGIAGASTFDPGLIERQGAALGREARAQGQDVLLAPALNIIRVPQCGRAFEYYSEDPVLTARCAAAAVEGIQSESVIATPKHYVANGQETDRVSVSAEVSERALREIYLPGFHDAIEAGARAVMTAYNRVNGTHMSDHPHLVTDVLKEEWAFPGFVVSDWWGTESTVGAANGGLDIEMPGVMPPGFDESDDEDAAAFMETAGSPQPGLEAPLLRGMPDVSKSGLFGTLLDDAIQEGAVSRDRLDDMVSRVLGAMAWAGLLDGRESASEIDEDEHRAIAEEVASRGIVLLENDGILPLADETTVALIGPNIEEVTLGGGGSSETDPLSPISTATGIRDRAGGPVTVEHGAARIKTPSFFEILSGTATPGEADEAVDMDDAVAAAASADVAVVVVRDWMTEGADRESLALPGSQDELVEAVAAANDRTVAVVQSGGPVDLPWRGKVAALLEAWYPGQADGAALASVLYGDIDASGRLPVTFAPADTYPASERRTFPGETGEVHHEEGVFVGYRHFDRNDVTPTYPFGYGRSYADFDYRDAAVIEDNRVRVTIENVASCRGRAVIQAYVAPPDGTVERPVRELAGFVAIDVAAGESTTVDVSLDERAFAHWDGEWSVGTGTYSIDIGNSSRDTRETLSIER